MATSSFNPDLTKTFIAPLVEELKAAPGRAYRMVWDAFFPVLVEHWFLVLVLLVVLLVIAFLRWLVTGRWALLGSVLYHYLYLAIMLVIGLIGGPEFYANDYFPLIGLAVYIVSFTTVGIILYKTGISRRLRF